MEQPKFAKGQKVKFIHDHDKMTGEVLSFTYDSEHGYTYKISSKYYDADMHDMVTGIKICKEAELQDMTNYTGATTPAKPDTQVNLNEKI